MVIQVNERGTAETRSENGHRLDGSFWVFYDMPGKKIPRQQDTVDSVDA